MTNDGIEAARCSRERDQPLSSTYRMRFDKLPGRVATWWATIAGDWRCARAEDCRPTKGRIDNGAAPLECVLHSSQ